jgi:hypothetical protein
MNSFYTNFSNESAERLILKLPAGSSFNEGLTQIEFLNANNDFIGRYEFGGELDFEQISEVGLAVNKFKKKYKGLIKAIIRSTIAVDKFMLYLTSEASGSEELSLVRGE